MHVVQAIFLTCYNTSFHTYLYDVFPNLLHSLINKLDSKSNVISSTFKFSYFLVLSKTVSIKFNLCT